jgi:hypothetical protein
LRRLWRWRDDHYDVVWNGVMAGRIFCLDAVGPKDRPWMWASGHSAATIKRAAHGYEATREAAMAAFAKTGGGNIEPPGPLYGARVEHECEHG